MTLEERNGLFFWAVRGPDKGGIRCNAVSPVRGAPRLDSSGHLGAKRPAPLQTWGRKCAKDSYLSLNAVRRVSARLTHTHAGRVVEM